MNMNLERMIVKQQATMLPQYRKRVEDYLESFPYGWFITLSFDDDRFDDDRYSSPVDDSVRDDGLKKVKSWLMWNARTWDSHLVPFESAEPQYSNGRFSVHMVLLSDKKIRVNDLKTSWKYGNTWIKVYQHELGGIEYTFTNHVGVESWLICSGKNPCRKNRKGRLFCAYEEHRRLIV